MKMKKFIAVLATVGMVAALAAGCGSGDDASADKGTKTGSASSDWDSSNDITIVSREDGSGTRGAFVELFGIQQEVDGEKVDMTTVDAQVTNNTPVAISASLCRPVAYPISSTIFPVSVRIPCRIFCAILG